MRPLFFFFFANEQGQVGDLGIHGDSTQTWEGTDRSFRIRVHLYLSLDKRSTAEEIDLYCQYWLKKKFG